MGALCRRQEVLAYGFQLSDWRCQGKIPAWGEKNVAGIQACLAQSLSEESAQAIAPWAEAVILLRDFR